MNSVLYTFADGDFTELKPSEETEYETHVTIENGNFSNIRKEITTEIIGLINRGILVPQKTLLFSFSENYLHLTFDRDETEEGETLVEFLKKTNIDNKRKQVVMLKFKYLVCELARVGYIHKEMLNCVRIFKNSLVKLLRCDGDLKRNMKNEEKLMHGYETYFSIVEKLVHEHNISSYLAGNDDTTFAKIIVNDAYFYLHKDMFKQIQGIFEKLKEKQEIGKFITDLVTELKTDELLKELA